MILFVQSLAPVFPVMIRFSGILTSTFFLVKALSLKTSLLLLLGGK